MAIGQWLNFFRLGDARPRFFESLLRFARTRARGAVVKPARLQYNTELCIYFRSQSLHSAKCVRRPVRISSRARTMTTYCASYWFDKKELGADLDDKM